MLGRRAKGGWVLSRFALHAPELSAEVGEDPLVRLPRELITSAILPSLDATEDHDFDVIRRDDYIPSPHPPILLLYPCRATYRAEHSLLFSTYLMPALLSFFLPSLFSFFLYLFISSALLPFPLPSSRFRSLFPFPLFLSFFFFFFFYYPPPPFIISPDRSTEKSGPPLASGIEIRLRMIYAPRELDVLSRQRPSDSLRSTTDETQTEP